MQSAFDRRTIVQVTTGLVLAGSAIALPVSVNEALAEDENTKGKKGESAENKMPEVTPPEDLMREHGVLNRVLLIYEAAIPKLTAKEDFDASILNQSAQIIKDFIEDYHERNEEQQLFPRFLKAGQLVELVGILSQQHQAGRQLTATIIELTKGGRGVPDDNRQRIITAMQSFIRMYRPHEAREDTELFPRLRSVVSPQEFDAMGEDFEKEEQQKFGQDGFEMMVDRVARLEKALGINDLSKFTPT